MVDFVANYQELALRKRSMQMEFPYLSTPLYYLDRTLSFLAPSSLQFLPVVMLLWMRTQASA